MTSSSFVDNPQSHICLVYLFITRFFGPEAEFATFGAKFK